MERKDFLKISSLGVVSLYLPSVFNKSFATAKHSNIRNLFECVNERHDLQSGKPLGVETLGMSCTVVSMMFEGMSKKYRLKLKSR